MILSDIKRPPTDVFNMGMSSGEPEICFVESVVVVLGGEGGGHICWGCSVSSRDQIFRLRRAWGRPSSLLNGGGLDSPVEIYNPGVDFGNVSACV